MFVGSVVFASSLADASDSQVESDGAFRAWGAEASVETARHWGALVFEQDQDVSAGGVCVSGDGAVSERASRGIPHQSIQP